jgi:hypothetical protein
MARNPRYVDHFASAAGLDAAAPLAADLIIDVLLALLLRRQVAKLEQLLNAIAPNQKITWHIAS